MYENLAKAAKEAAERARPHISGYHVGAAILTVGGDIFVGCNIEFDNFSNTIHAEECAISNFIANGHLPWYAVAMAVYTKEDKPWLPCGMCRQSIYEIFRDDFIIVTCNDNGVYKIYTQEEMLPAGYNRRRKLMKDEIEQV